MLRRIPTSVPCRASSCLLSSRAPLILTSPAPTRLPSRPASTRRMSSLPPVSAPLSTSLPSDSFHLLSDPNKPGPPEDALYEQQIKDVEAWWATPRYAGIKRPYTAADVVSKRGSLQQTYPSSLMARKLWDLIQERLNNGEPIHTSTSDSSSNTQHHDIILTRTCLSLKWAPSTLCR